MTPLITKPHSPWLALLLGAGLVLAPQARSEGQKKQPTQARAAQAAAPAASTPKVSPYAKVNRERAEAASAAARNGQAPAAHPRKKVPGAGAAQG